MRSRNQGNQGYDDWNDGGEAYYGAEEPDARNAYAYDDQDDYDQPDDYGNARYSEPQDEQGLMLQPEQSLVGVSSTVTHHGAPLLSYTRTMNRFYTTRKQKLSLGRYKCEVCGERIRFWAWLTPNGNKTHDGCYERLAWTWTNLYAYQQRLASQGQFE